MKKFDMKRHIAQLLFRLHLLPRIEVYVENGRITVTATSGYMIANVADFSKFGLIGTRQSVFFCAGDNITVNFDDVDGKTNESPSVT